MITKNFTIITNDHDTADFIHKLLHHHELARQSIQAGGSFKVYSAETKELFTLSPERDGIHVDGPIHSAEPPKGPKDLILEEGFCHTVDVMETTRDLPIPDDLVEYNFIFAKRAERCGCCSCGAIFPGSEVKDCTRDSKGDIAGTAFCPHCGGMSVVVEEGDIKVSENNLWRWNRHLYDELDMYDDHPAPAPRKFF